MYYCSTHLIHHKSFECPRCVEEEHHEETLNAWKQQHEEALDAAREQLEATKSAEYRRANPGEHECPHCRYISLKWAASRCPLCRGEITSTYWERESVAQSERWKRESEAASARREEEERARSAQAAASDAAESASQRKREFKAVVYGVFFATVWGVFYKDSPSSQGG